MGRNFRPSVWLTELGLGEYGELFERNGVDAAVLGSLTADDLLEMGVAAVGHRRKILSAAATFIEAAAASPTRPSFPWQRRRVTVCFVDIVGFTQRTAQLDPEDIQSLLNGFYVAVEAALEALGGRIVKRLGDGVLAAFGWPASHEDDARRAVLAALSAREAASGAREGLAVRIGIATGLVLAAEESGRVDVLGEAVNLAARLQPTAPPGGVVIDAETRALMRGAAAAVPLGSLPVKGFACPVEAFAVTGPTDQPEAPRGGGDQLFGRARENGVLDALWRRVRDGRGAVALLVGEPGMGKTRLVQRLTDMAHAAGDAVHAGACREWLAISALHPIRGMVARRAGAPPGARLEAFLPAVERALAAAEPAADAALGARSLASVFWPRAADGLSIGPKEIRNAAFAALRALLLRPAPGSAAVVVIEDLHWSDPSTLEFLCAVRADLANRPVLLLLTSRDHPEALTGDAGPDVLLRLAKLDAEAARSLVEAEIGARAVSPAVVDDLVARSGGVPLFLAELARAYGRDGWAGPDAAPPAQFGGLLTARIDGLGERKGLAMAAACLGPDFTPELLARIVDMDPELARADLARLSRSGVIERSGTRFRFTHGLMRDAAWHLLPHAERRRLHGRILDALTSLGERPELLARHAMHADRHAAAARWAQEAGRRALGAAALREAVAHFRLAIAALEAAQDAGDTRCERAWLTLKLAHATNSLEGSGSPETAACFERAMILAQHADPSGAYFPASYGLSVMLFVRAELTRSETVGREMLRRAEADSESDGAPGRRMMACNLLATLRMLRGDFAGGEALFGDVARHEAGADVARLVWEYGHDPRGVLRAHRALARVGLGDAEGAVAVWSEGMAMVEGGTHRQSTAQPLVFGALIHMILGRPGAARALVDRALVLTRELDLAMWRNFAECLDAWLWLEAGEAARAAATLGPASARLDAGGIAYLRPWRLALAAAVAERTGDGRAAAAAHAAARAHVAQTGERWAEAMRMRITAPE